MSDLLTNLAARSLGTAAGIRPRVPSLYEPHRQDTGLLGIRQVSTEADDESPLEYRSRPGAVFEDAMQRGRFERHLNPFCSLVCILLNSPPRPSATRLRSRRQNITQIHLPAGPGATQDPPNTRQKFQQATLRRR